MAFLPRRDGEEDGPMTEPPESTTTEAAAERHTDHRLQTEVTSDELQSRLLVTYYAANSFVQEQGRPRLGDVEGDLESLARTRERLSAYSRVINTPVGDTGTTPYRALGELSLLQQQSVGAIVLEICFKRGFIPRADSEHRLWV